MPVTSRLPRLIATSVVRGSQQGESHGGVFTVDFERRSGEQHVDWNTSAIDFTGRGADRGLRGIAFDDEDIYIAASDELYCYDRAFSVQGSFRNRYLKHCHEICVMGDHLFLTTTGFDSLLAFNLETRQYEWGFHLQKQYGKWSGHTFDPLSDTGPAAVNDFHINMVHVDESGIYLSGLRTGAMLFLDRHWQVSEVCSLPQGAHNARPWRGGIVFNDTDADCVRYVPRQGKQQAFRISRYDESQIRFAGIDDSKIARQAFGRGLCTVGDRYIAAGSSPSTITLYDVERKLTVGSVNLSMDIRNAIHGLEVWPFDD
ncbi:MAG TPA: hypothetical protein VLB07_14420 [Woeseiaceae bacterium]|nr:hypothetical protein [Woeseiaceae bacterium]